MTNTTVQGNDSNLVSYRSQFPWAVLHIFNAYRIIIALLILVCYFLEFKALILGGYAPIAFLVTIICYIVFSLLLLWPAYQRLPSFEVLAAIAVFTDIALLIILARTSIGLLNVFVILINATIAAGSIITAGRISLLFAAYASIAMMIAYGVFGVDGIWHDQGFIQAGVIGATFFATAMLGYGLSKRIRVSEAIAFSQQHELNQLDQLNKLIIERLQSGVMLLDNAGMVIYINEAAWKLLDLSPISVPFEITQLPNVIYKSLLEWKSKPVVPRVYQKNFPELNILLRFITSLPKDEKNHTTVIFIEDNLRMAEQVQRMKLTSLGRLTASIAHEIRNPLAAITHAAQLLEESADIHGEDEHLSKIIYKQSIRVNKIIKNVLQLSRREDSNQTKILLKPWLENFLDDLKKERMQQPQITLQVSPEDIEIDFDINNLQQILLNLCENGIAYSLANMGEAMIEVNAGEIVETGEKYIEVIDHGAGVSEDITQYIFDPFFTTKRNGTGLGLYIAKELCEGNNAQLSYSHSQLGGSCFRISTKPY